MKQRTNDERERIVRNCVRIEKAGGDVLEYLASEHYISPRATWYNIQRCDLERKELTDGHPKKRRRKVELIPEGTTFEKDRNLPKEPRQRQYIKFKDIYKEMAMEMIVEMSRGVNPFEILKARGEKNPWYRWSEIVKWSRTEEPEIYNQLIVLYEQLRISKVIKGSGGSRPLYMLAEQYAMMRE